MALFGDLAEVVFVGRGVDGWSQADVTHDVLAVRKARQRPEDEHGRQRGQRPDAGVREREASARIGRGYGGDQLVEPVDPGRQPNKQFETVITPARGVR